MWRNVNGLRIVAEFAADHGMTRRALLTGTGLRAAQLDDPATTISFEQECAAIRNLLHQVGDGPGLGLQVGRRYRFTTLAPVGFALVSSPDLRSAFDIMLRYANLNVSLVGVELAAPGPDLHIGFVDDALPPEVRRFAVERALAVALSLARELVGRPLVPRAVGLGFPPPPDAAPYRELLGTTPAFGASRHVLVLNRADAEASFSHGNPLALKMAEAQCRQYLDEWRARSGVAAQVRDRLAMQARDMPSTDELAAALCMSARTLRRRLHDEGTGYLALCDEVREALAEQLLAMPRLPVEQIAERLGYAETASFIHAFKRWKGMTPRTFRTSGRPGGKPRDRGL